MSVVSVSLEHGVSGGWSGRAESPGECTVFFEGWLVDRAELARELGLTGESSDAELALEVYRRWSVEGFAKLRGGFAVVVWDQRERVVRAVRDQVGVHPLFRAEAGGTHLISPSIDALVADSRVPRSADRGALLGLLAPSMPFQDETPYRAVRRIPQGHVWELTARGSRVYRYWDPSPPAEPLEWVSDEDLGTFDELLERAIARCVSLGRPAIFLSGGLDSVSVAAVASDLGARGGLPPLWALSLAFPRGPANEEVVQRSVAQTLGMPQVMLPLGEAAGPQGVFQAALDLVADWPVPLQGLWLPAYLRLNAEAVERGCQAILTGGGGDEWLTVNPYWAADLMKRVRLAQLVQFAVAYRRSFPLKRRYVLWNLWHYGARQVAIDAGTWAAPGVLATQRVRHRERRLPNWLAADPEAVSLLRERLGAPRASAGIKSPYVREVRSALDHALMDLVMEEMFEGARRSGLRVVQPYWDPDLLGFLYRVRPDKLHQGGRSKGLVREYLDRRFPDCGFGLQRKVAATNVFMAVTLEQAPAARRRVGPIQALADLGVVDGARIERAIDEMLAGRTSLSSHRIWDILNVEAWARAHL